MRQLSNTERKLIILFYYNHANYKEISEQMNISYGRIKNFITEALKKLKKQLIEIDYSL